MGECSPYRGTPEEVKRNFDYAVELTKEVLMDVRQWAIQSAVKCCYLALTVFL